MHPDFRDVVHLYLGGPVVDDDDPLIYIGDGVQAAGLYFAGASPPAWSSFAQELPDDSWQKVALVDAVQALTVWISLSHSAITPSSKHPS